MLAALGNTEGLRMKEVAAHMATSSAPSNATRVCSALEKRGLLKRRRAPDTDREVIARLTAKGQALFEEVFPVVTKATRDLVDAGLSAKDREMGVRVLQRYLQKVPGAGG